MKMQLDHQFTINKIFSPQIILMTIFFSLTKMRSEIHKFKPEDLEETIIEKSTTHSGTNEPNETSIRD
jgi:hypothetical protein